MDSKTVELKGYDAHEIVRLAVADGYLGLAVTEEPHRPPLAEIQAEGGAWAAAVGLTEPQIGKLITALEKAREKMRSLEARPITAYRELPRIVSEFIRYSAKDRKNLRFTTADDTEVLIYADRAGAYFSVTNVDVQPRGTGTFARILDALEAFLPRARFKGIEFGALTNMRFKAWLVGRGYIEIEPNTVRRDFAVERQP